MAVQAPSPARGTSWSVRFRLGLALSVLLVIAGTVLVGELPAGMGDFDAAVAAGRVHAVRLVGDLPAGVSGSSLVELHWRDRSISRVGQVRQIVSDGPVPPGSSSGERVVVGDLVAALSSAHPGLAVTSGAGAFSTGLRGTVLGWQVPGWIVLAHALAWLVTLAFLINGPEPWRATRWAWFWIIANPLGAIGALAFLLLSGPTPLLPAARPGGRRLHGGWAFLLATVVSGPWRQ